MRYFLGIDGGGTRTTAWLADERGGVLARAEAGPANPLKVGFEACERELLLAARTAIRIANVPSKRGGAGLKPAPAKFESVVAGLAGVDRPPVHARLFRWLKKSFPARHHLLTSDAAIALEAAIGGDPGIMVISGTGSIAYARDAKGRALRSGGWGTLFDDAGSGYEIGRSAIVAALRDFDGRGKQTILGRKICRALGLRDITQIILKALTPQQIAALSPLVLEAARRGDSISRGLLDLAGRDLADLALALASRLGWKRREFTVVMAGGVFNASECIRREFARLLRGACPRARVVHLRRPAVEGALSLGYKIAHRGLL